MGLLISLVTNKINIVHSLGRPIDFSEDGWRERPKWRFGMTNDLVKMCIFLSLWSWSLRFSSNHPVLLFNRRLGLRNAGKMFLWFCVNTFLKWVKCWVGGVVKSVPFRNCPWKKRVWIHWRFAVDRSEAVFIQLLVFFHKVLSFTVFQTFCFDLSFVSYRCEVFWWWYSRH